MKENQKLDLKTHRIDQNNRRRDENGEKQFYPILHFQRKNFWS